MDLNQDPTVMPIIGPHLPCLLRGGRLWMDDAPMSSEADTGRLLIPTERMTSLGIPWTEDHCVACGLDYPIFQNGYHQTNSELESEAGNGMNAISIGSINKFTVVLTC
jgi:hypothetical protein